MRPLSLVVLLPLFGCSLVNDPSVHMGNPQTDASQDSNADAGSDSAVDTAADADTPGPIPADEFCTEYASVTCQAKIDCCTTAREDELEMCRAEQVAACARSIGISAATPSTAYDPSIARDVLNDLISLADNCSTNALDFFTDREDGFERMFRGTIAQGGECSPANATAVSCAGGNVCQPRTALLLRWDCNPPQAEGTDCPNDLSCMDTLWCDNRVTGQPAQCTEKLADGQPCLRNFACQSLLCVGPFGNKTCAARTADDVYCLTSSDT